MTKNSVKPELIDHIGFDLWRAAQAWKYAYEAEMVQRGFTWFGEARSSLVPHIPPEGIAQTLLVTKAGISKQAVQQHLDDLVRDGVVERVADPVDARRKIVRYTGQGVEALHVANEVKREIEARYRARMGANTLKTLREALTSIIEDQG